MNSNPQDLKSLILNTNEPLIFKDVWNSKMLEWNLDKWREVLKDKELVFRSGVFEATNEPQWERKTESKTGSFEYFMEQTSSNSNWLYFDYKYLAEWFTDLADLRENISWALFGFPEKTADDSTIWIGSKGAHTPCHVDTYGFNLIHQVFGRKLWIIAPPDENLKPTRIPYEESSVYSRLNFFSPSDQEFKGLSNFRKIVLNPGEVLYLPHKWWHYVEHLETAISINVWIPSPDDDRERLKESIVQLLVKQMTNVSDDETNRCILNPNMEEIVLNSDFNSILKTMSFCKNVGKDKLKIEEKTEGSSKRENIINVEEYSFVEKVPVLTQEQFTLFLEGQRKRFARRACKRKKESEKGSVGILKCPD